MQDEGERKYKIVWSLSEQRIYRQRCELDRMTRRQMDKEEGRTYEVNPAFRTSDD